MAESAQDHNYGGGVTTFEAFGVKMWVATNRREARDRIPEILPPGWRPYSGNGEIKHRLGILCDDRGTYRLDLGTGLLFDEGVPLELALELLATIVQMRVALDAPGRIFVHAGVVGHGGRALLIPGSSFSGKTTLVAALVRAGAIYYSDDFAPIDADGLVHPYPKPLSVRGDDQLQTDHHVATLGGIAGDEPLRIGTVLVTTYRPGAEWHPKRLSAGTGALALLSNTVPARKRPEEALRTITQAVDGAILLEGDRGEADALAPLLLGELEAQTP